MNLYSNKQRWKLILLFAAMAIIAVTLWYTNSIASKIKDEERAKIGVWSEAIKNQAKLVVFTDALFEDLKSEERKKADLLRQAYVLLNQPQVNEDLTFLSNVIRSNTTIPLLIYNGDRLDLYANLPDGKENDQNYLDSLKQITVRKGQVITAEIEGGDKLFVHYNDSYIFEELQIVLSDLIDSFISETVLNSASVPVILTDSTRTNIVSSRNITWPDDCARKDTLAKVASLSGANPPIEILLPGGKNYIYFEDSWVLTQLKYFPFVQLLLISLFLLIAYLIFSAFRKAEQNQVWVGMAKETAHQLGTPLSSLLAWIELLDAQGADPETVKELSKDVNRLAVITERFSKIGSKPELSPQNLNGLLKETVDYLRPRISSKVKTTVDEKTESIDVLVNPPLLSWVLENLSKNAVDAMDGVGELHYDIGLEGKYAFIDITDTGKGIAKNQHRTVFQPGYTTKKRGWGLGLSLVKRIIDEYHEGRVFVKRSEIGAGTTFRILLDTVRDETD